MIFFGNLLKYSISYFKLSCFFNRFKLIYYKLKKRF